MLSQVMGPYARYDEHPDRWVNTRTSLAEAVTATVRALHSYDTPEVIAIPVVASGADYLRWLEAEASGGGNA